MTIIVLLFATQLKHKSRTPIRDGPVKAEVTFCVQGAISPLLANIHLHPLDRLMAESGYRMVRYADDFVILCRTAHEAQAALRRAMAWVADNGLGLHPDKTRIGDCREPGQGFDFLGYRFEAGRQLVREKSLRPFKDKVRAMTGRRRGASMRRIIDDLNPMLRGWFGYFKQARRPFIAIWTASSDEGCGPSCASRKSGQASAAVPTITNAGLTHSSPISGCSPFPRSAITRDIPDEETSNRRAVCGRTARTVRREGRPKPSLPLSCSVRRSWLT
jgi:hypothetical protein